MQSKALFVTMQARAGADQEIAQWLCGAVVPIEAEPDTQDWYALQIDEGQFAIFDTFDHNTGRIKHLLGKVGRGLVVRTFTLLHALPDIQVTDIVESAVPLSGTRLRRAVCTRGTAFGGRGAEAISAAAKLLRQAHPDPTRSAWYLLRIGAERFLALEFLTQDMVGVAVGPRFGTALAPLCRDIEPSLYADILASRFAGGAASVTPSADRASAAVG